LLLCAGMFVACSNSGNSKDSGDPVNSEKIAETNPSRVTFTITNVKAVQSVYQKNPDGLAPVIAGGKIQTTQKMAESENRVQNFCYFAEISSEGRSLEQVEGKPLQVLRIHKAQVGNQYQIILLDTKFAIHCDSTFATLNTWGELRAAVAPYIRVDVINRANNMLSTDQPTNSAQPSNPGVPSTDSQRIGDTDLKQVTVTFQNVDFVQAVYSPEKSNLSAAVLTNGEVRDSIYYFEGKKDSEKNYCRLVGTQSPGQGLSTVQNLKLQVANVDHGNMEDNWSNFTIGLANANFVIVCSSYDGMRTWGELRKTLGPAVQIDIGN
jgi:hypothetical protein